LKINLINNPVLKDWVVASDRNGFYVGLIPFYRWMNQLRTALKLPRASEFLGIKPTDGIKNNEYLII
jgi:hypothetical protein